MKAGGRPADGFLQAGVTLTELVVAVAILALVTSFSVPALNGLMAGAGLAGITNELLADMTLARSEAVRRGAPVVICSSRDGETCSGATDWDQGWILFAAGEGEGAAPPAATGEDALIRVTRREGGRFRLGASHAWVVYQADGTIRVP